MPSDELDSFMFQTVGHDLIDLYSECMGIPIFRRAISGGSVVQEMDYTTQAGDEVEDLYELLARVKVCFGAVQLGFGRKRSSDVLL